jgi:hypothetical protein
MINDALVGSLVGLIAHSKVIIVPLRPFTGIQPLGQIGFLWRIAYNAPFSCVRKLLPTIVKGHFLATPSLPLLWPDTDSAIVCDPNNR